MRIIFKVPTGNANDVQISDYKTNRIRKIKTIMTEAYHYAKKDLEYYDIYFVEILIETEEEEQKMLYEIKEFVKNIYTEMNDKKLANANLYITRKGAKNN